jgi:hypothetical protein
MRRGRIVNYSQRDGVGIGQPPGYDPPGWRDRLRDRLREMYESVVGWLFWRN